MSISLVLHGFINLKKEKEKKQWFIYIVSENTIKNRAIFISFTFTVTLNLKTDSTIPEEDRWNLHLTVGQTTKPTDSSQLALVIIFTVNP